MNCMWSFFKRGRPRWFTSLPFHESPGVLAFATAIGRSLILTAVFLLALFPFFRVRHGDEFDFSFGEGLFFAFVYVFFEEHARWNYIVNALRPFVAATKFAVMISIVELLLFYLSHNESLSFLHLAYARLPVVALHLFLGYAAACVFRRNQYQMFVLFVACLTVHAGFNFFGVAYWVSDVLKG